MLKHATADIVMTLFYTRNVCVKLTVHTTHLFSKCRYSYSFHPITANPYENTGNHGGIQGITFLDVGPN